MVPNLRVCTDCYTCAANGSGELDSDAVARINAAAAKLGELVASCGDPDGPCHIPDGAGGMSCDGAGFSWSSCDYCGTTLGGDRWHAVLLNDLRDGTDSTGGRAWQVFTTYADQVTGTTGHIFRNLTAVVQWADDNYPDWFADEWQASSFIIADCDTQGLAYAEAVIGLAFGRGDGCPKCHEPTKWCDCRK
jgi:hypothetical protein